MIKYVRFTPPNKEYIKTISSINAQNAYKTRGKITFFSRFLAKLGFHFKDILLETVIIFGS